MMASAQLEFAKQGMDKAPSASYPIFISKRSSSDGNEANDVPNKQQRVLYADDSGTYHIPSIAENEENEIQALEEGQVDSADEEELDNPNNLEQTTNDSDEDEANNYNKVIGAKAETLITKEHFRDKRGKKHLVYSCNVCEAEYKDRRTCIRHIRNHTGERPFKCLDCGKSFTREDYLTRHIKGHSGEKDFECHICSKEFLRKGSLDQHMLLHKDPADRPYPCDQCEKSFVKRSYLERHMKRHTKAFEFFCNQCGKGFYENWTLIDHCNRVHTDTNRSFCPICHRKFYTSYLLKKHMPIHGEPNS